MAASDPMPLFARFPASGLNDRIAAKTVNSASSADRPQPLQSSLSPGAAAEAVAAPVATERKSASSHKQPWVSLSWNSARLELPEL
jgi:hypothetical protein